MKPEITEISRPLDHQRELRGVGDAERGVVSTQQVIHLLAEPRRVAKLEAVSQIRRSRLQCIGDDWTLSVEAVAAGATPQTLMLSASTKQDDAVLSTAKSRSIAVGAAPVTPSLPLRVQAVGPCRVDVQVLSEAGRTLA